MASITQKTSFEHYLDVGNAKTVRDLFRIARALQFGASSANLWFRGQSNNSWHLRPKLWELGYDAKGESEAFGTFLTQAPARYGPCPPHDDTAGWLCLMQHFGLPTRLLDWTKSVLIAAYFAVRDEENDSLPGAIWVTSQGILNFYMTGRSPSEALNNTHLGIGTATRLRAVAVGSPRVDTRMMVQQGAFTVHNDATPLEDISEARTALHRITIPADPWKQNLRSELDRLCGINEATLFPDLEHLASHIRATIVPAITHNPPPGFNVNAINVAETPEIPLDAEILFSRPKIQSGSMHLKLDPNRFSGTTYAASVCPSGATAPAPDREPKPRDPITITHGDFSGFPATIEAVDASTKNAKAVINLFGLETRIQLRRADFDLR